MVNEINNLLSIEDQKELEKSLAYATGFGVVFIDKNGDHIGEGSNFCELCKYFNSQPEGKEKCRLSNSEAIKIAMETNKPCIYLCHANLINIEIPLYFEGEYIGGLTAGNVRCSDNSKFLKAKNKIKYNKDTSPLIESYEKIEIFSDDKIQATANFLNTIVNYIVQINAKRKLDKELCIQKDKLHILEKEKLTLEKELMRFKFLSLEKQMLPHFIFNILNTISRMIEMNQINKANEVLLKFANLLRYNLNQANKLSDLNKEVDYVESYLDLQKIRFGDKFDYNILNNLDKDMTIIVPSISLQPFIENSIKHGFYDIARKGYLSLILNNEGSKCFIDISDNGKGLNQVQLKKLRKDLLCMDNFTNKIGIFNSFTRLRLLYGDSFRWSINSHIDQGFKVKMEFDSNSIDYSKIIF